MNDNKNGSNCLVIIPARNEEMTIARVVRDVFRAVPCQVVVVDDNSSDTTTSAARSAGAVVLSLAQHLGAWGAIQTGMRYALTKGYRTVVTMDADGQHRAEDINQLLNRLRETGHNVIVAAYPQRGSWQRQIAWRFFRRLTGLNLQDLTSGFRAYDRRSFAMLAAPGATLLDYQDIGVLLMLQGMGMRVSEIDTFMPARSVGKSRIFNTWASVAVYLGQSLILSLCRRNKIFPKIT